MSLKASANIMLLLQIGLLIWSSTINIVHGSYDVGLLHMAMLINTMLLIVLISKTFEPKDKDTDKDTDKLRQ
jgi:hypothetical protein